MQLNIIQKRGFEFFLWVVVGLLLFLNIFLVLFGNRTAPKIIQTNLQKQFTAANLRQFLFTFNRNMDRKSVESYFSVTPKVQGKFSWNGRNLAFTPEETLPYGNYFQLKISKEAKDQDGVNMSQDYFYNFRTLPLKFAYIGSEGPQKDQIIASNISGTEVQVLTDSSLKVHTFQITPDGRQIYFFASKENFFNEPRNELYLLNLEDKKIIQITQDKKFLNKSFLLSPDGQTIALSRVAVSPDGELLTRIEVWIASIKDYQFEKFKDGKATGTNIIFTPDSKYLVYRNSESNFELSPMDKKNSEEPLFLGEFSTLYGIHPYKPIIAFVKYDEQDVFSLNNFLTLYFGDGQKKDLPFGSGIVRDTVFTKDGKGLIAIFSLPKEQFDDKESFYPLRIFHLYSYDLETEKLTKLTNDLDYSEENPVISPDSRYVLFLRNETFNGDLVIDPGYRDIAESLGSIMKGGEIWSLDLKTKELKNLQVRGSQLAFFP